MLFSWLEMGNLVIGAYDAYSIPFENLLLFSQNETHTEDEEIEGFESGDQWFEFKTVTKIKTRYQFLTTVQKARNRLNSLGFDMKACEQLFNAFRSETITRFGCSEQVEIKNDILFAEYKTLLASAYAVSLERRCSLDNWQLWDNIDSRLADAVGGRIFGYPHRGYFSEPYLLITWRVLLETAPDDTKLMLDITDLIERDMNVADRHASYITEQMMHLRERIEVDYKVYGFFLEQDPTINERLRKRLGQMSERQFLSYILYPLLDKMKYEYVRVNVFHGPGELGKDIHPFRYVTPLGTVEYYAVQAKVVSIHGTNSRRGNAGEILSQAVGALGSEFLDPSDQEKKKIDKFIIITTKNITPDARKVIEDGITSKRSIIFIDLDRILELIKQYHLMQYVLFAEFDEI